MKLVELLARELNEWPYKRCVAIAQDANSEVYGWSGEPEYEYGNWLVTGCANVTDRVIADSELLATDHATAIVTREMWEDEKARIAKSASKPKANKDGWIRHRGGKCPVEAGVKVDYRMRDGSVMTQPAGALEWSYLNECGDIMAYRICDSDQAPKPSIREASQVESPSLECQTVGLVSRINPLQWRDRIREIDTTVEALEEERVSLIQRLEGEGLQLVQGNSCGSFIPEFDQADKETWRIGDLLEIVGSDNRAWKSRKGKIGRLCYDDKMYRGGWYIFFDDDDDWCVSDNTDIKFHSRQSA